MLTRNSDLVRQRALAAKLRAHEASTSAPLAVSLDEFFTGNDDYASIGCNLMRHPGPERFYEVLRELRNQEGVQDIFVQLHQYEGEQFWPFSEIVHVITTLGPETVKEWTEELQPDDVNYGPFNGRMPVGLPEARPGHRIVTLWWD
jgi:hypothetical protein